MGRNGRLSRASFGSSASSDREAPLSPEEFSREFFSALVSIVVEEGPYADRNLTYNDARCKKMPKLFHDFSRITTAWPNFLEGFLPCRESGRMEEFFGEASRAECTLSRRRMHARGARRVTQRHRWQLLCGFGVHVAGMMLRPSRGKMGLVRSKDFNSLQDRCSFSGSFYKGL